MQGFSRFIAITLSAVLCAVVAWYIYQLMWVGHMADLGISITWKARAVPLQPTLYALVLLAVLLTSERIASYANPGRGFLWWYDVVPSVLLLGWFLFTGFVHFWREFTFTDPSLLWVYVTFTFSELIVVATSAFFWFGEPTNTASHARDEEVVRARHDLEPAEREEPQRATLVAGRPPLTVAGTSLGQYVSVLPGGSFRHLVPDGCDVLFKRTGHSNFRLDNVPKERAAA